MLRYVKTLEVLNRMIELCFQEIERERNKEMPNQNTVDSLKIQFGTVIRERDELVMLSEDKCQEILDKYEPMLQKRACGAA